MFVVKDDDSQDLSDENLLKSFADAPEILPRLRKTLRLRADCGAI
jgi:hypothetical protein